MSETYEVTLPKLGESIMNATIVQWFKKEGESVAKDEPLLEVATDKVNSEIPSPVAGTIQSIKAQIDQELNVGEILAIISTNASTAPTQKKEKEAPKLASAPTSSENKDYLTPAVLRLAQEKQIPIDQLKTIAGTGEGGRITKKDLETYLQNQIKPCPHKPKELKEGTMRIKMTPLRKSIAENMVKAYREVPHASLVCEVDVTEIVQLIAKEKETFFQKHKVKLTLTSFVARAIAKTLREYPQLNAEVDGDEIIVKHFVNLGIAVSVPDGVMVPVIRNCDTKTLLDIAKDVATFAQKSRSNSLKPDDVKEGTATMTNFGMAGMQIGIPILRYPEVAIIGIGAVTKKVVAITDTSFGVRSIMNICLSFDHRVVDGIYSCNFLSALKTHLESELKVD